MVCYAVQLGARARPLLLCRAGLALRPSLAVPRAGVPTPPPLVAARRLAPPRFAPSRAGVSGSPATRRRGLSRRPPLAFSFVLLRCCPLQNRPSHVPAFCALWPSFSRHFARPCVSAGRRARRVALVGLLRPSLGRAIRPAAKAARPTGGTAVVASLLFFRLARRFASRACRGFPSSAARRGLPPAAPRRVPAVCTHFLSRAGREGCPLPCSGLRPCAPRGGRAARPPAPRGAPTRRAVFFIVFCYPRFRNFGALSALRRIKNHK